MRDPIIKSLHSMVEEDDESKLSDITIRLEEWKTTFCLRWYGESCGSKVKSLAAVWSLLLDLTDFSNGATTVSASNAIGRLIVALLPFHLVDLIASFRAAVDDLPVIPRMSMYVITTFVYLSQHVGRHYLSRLSGRDELLCHFSFDVRPFARHIPLLVEHMSDLPLPFHVALLESLLRHCDSTVPGFVAAVTGILLRFPNETLPILLSSTEADRTRLLAFGPKLLEHRVLRHLLTSDVINQLPAWRSTSCVRTH
jgi:hypothetical protein